MPRKRFGHRSAISTIFSSGKCRDGHRLGPIAEHNRRGRQHSDIDPKLIHISDTATGIATLIGNVPENAVAGQNSRFTASPAPVLLDFVEGNAGVDSASDLDLNLRRCMFINRQRRGSPVLPSPDLIVVAARRLVYPRVYRA